MCHLPSGLVWPSRTIHPGSGTGRSVLQARRGAAMVKGTAVSSLVVGGFAPQAVLAQMKAGVGGKHEDGAVRKQSRSNSSRTRGRLAHPCRTWRHSCLGAVRKYRSSMVCACASATTLCYRAMLVSFAGLANDSSNFTLAGPYRFQ